MKKTSQSKLLRLGIVVAFCCAIIALLEVLDAHPQFSVGKFHVCWAGIRHMDFGIGTMTITLTNGRTEIQKFCNVGPIMMTYD
jgi:hypothetical protein